MVVYFDGYDKSWVDGRGVLLVDCCYFDDVGFLVVLVVKLVYDFDIVFGYVFVIGMFNGGFMFNWLVCDCVDIFVVVVLVVGMLGVGVICNLLWLVLVFEVYGIVDLLVLFNGGVVCGCGGFSYFILVVSLVDCWWVVDGC